MAGTVRKKPAPDVIGTDERPTTVVPPSPFKLQACEIGWWQTLWRTPVAATWTVSDRPLVWALTQLYVKLCEEPGAGIAGQIANISAQLGLNPRSRIQLSIEEHKEPPTELRPGRSRFADVAEAG